LTETLKVDPDEVREKLDKQTDLEKETEPEGVVKPLNWDAYTYLFGDADFEKFKKAYENLGEEVYQNALKQLGWDAVATSEECRQIADLMSVVADKTELKF
jgi:uncharacterized secreted protein with C-terminal beta-propeller domain